MAGSLAVLVLLAVAIILGDAAPDGSLQCPNMVPCYYKCGGSCSTSARSSFGKRGTGRITSERAQSAGYESVSNMQDLIKYVTAVAERQAMATLKTLRPNEYPDSTDPVTGQWKTTVPGRWTSGFFAGVLWQLHSLTSKQQWADQAQQLQAGLAGKQRAWVAQRDLGFIYQPTFAHSYEVTGNKEHLRQALAAAEALSWAYNPATGSLDCWQGWLPPGATDKYKQIVIIDFIINAQLLLWGSRHLGDINADNSLRMDTDPSQAWRDMAIQHARQVAANHVRPDGSTYHIVEYNPDTAAINKRYTYQGFSDNSTWARGHSWAVLGFAMMYQQTKMPEFLEVAQKVTDKWLTLLMHQPAGLIGDYVPIWDFNAPLDVKKDGPRDSSSAGIAALGMLYLAEAVGTDTACGKKYLCAAVNTLRVLASPRFLADPDNDGGFAAVFKHGVSNYPMNGGIDVGLSYGDYYTLYAFKKCSQMEACKSAAW